MTWEKDLIVLGADADVLALMRSLILKRSQDLGIRPLTAEKAEFLKDVLHDSSPPDAVASLLRGFLRTHQRALVIRDLEGSGYEERGATELENAITDELSRNGWSGGRAEAIVIEPEIERWLRFDSPLFAQAIREASRRPAAWRLDEFREKQGEMIAATGGEENQKPVRPKEVFEQILRAYRIPRSAKLYGQIAEEESVNGCTVKSFCKMVATLQKWFPATP